MTEETTQRVVTVNRGAEHSASQWPRRGTQHDALDAWVGRWINEGHVIDDDGSPGPTITTSDVYEWAPGASSTYRLSET